MKYLLYFTFTFLLFYRISGQIRCYSCSSRIGSTYGSRNYDCANNVTNVRSIRCRRGYYCLTSYTVRSGVVTYIRRTCQNPRTDYNQVQDDAPTQDGCISSHSRSFSVPASTTCYFHCTTNMCNKITPGKIQKCPDECINSCNIVTGQCIAPLRCVQCTSESDKGCEAKTAATACPRSSYNYCAATKTSVLTLDKQLIQTSVSKSCTRFTSSYSIPTEPCKFVASSSSSDSNYIKYTCSNFCSNNGCNVKLPLGSPTPLKDAKGLRCVVCYQAGRRGYGCQYLTRTSSCHPSATYCKATVSYYTSQLKSQSGRPIYRIAYIRRECAEKPATKQCVTTSLRDANLNFVTCQETCQTNGCNIGWPARPKCSQCDATNRTYSVAQFQRCQSNPYTARRCSSPLYEYCTTISNNTQSSPGYARRVKRGCSITALDTRCFDITVAGGKTINHCQSSCKTDGCNRGNTL